MGGCNGACAGYNAVLMPGVFMVAVCSVSCACLCPRPPESPHAFLKLIRERQSSLKGKEIMDGSPGLDDVECVLLGG